jgi:hypothetical protein
MVEVYTADAVVTGVPADPADLRQVLEGGNRVEIRQPRWMSLNPGPDPARRDDSLAVDDIIVAVGDVDSRRVVHASLHDVVLEAGPYRITGLLPVLPGFDPGRALTRPGGTFLQLRDARMEIINHPEAGELERDFVLVNRYSVDHVVSDLILGFFFPAAHFDPIPNVAAG